MNCLIIWLLSSLVAVSAYHIDYRNVDQRKKYDDILNDVMQSDISNMRRGNPFYDNRININHDRRVLNNVMQSNVSKRQSRRWRCNYDRIRYCMVRAGQACGSHESCCSNYSCYWVSEGSTCIYDPPRCW